MSQLRVIDPTHHSQWDQLIVSISKCSFFYSSSWARVLSESYGYRPIYFVSFDDGRLSSLIPIMEVNSLFTGRRGVSLPFTDQCQAILREEGDFEDLFENIIDYGKRMAWKYVELRGHNQFLKSYIHSSWYYIHTLNLTPSDEQIFAKFRDSTKRNINKAIREGVAVDICYSLDSIREFYRLNCMTRRHHGLPPQPFFFFKKVFDHVIARDQGMVLLASHKGKVIAGAVFFHFGDSAIFKYGASDMRFQLLRANNLVMWKAIRWCIEKGLRSVSFGRTMPENEGLRQFKRGLCSNEELIRYYRYDLSLETFLTDHSKEELCFAKMFKRMPISILKIIGSLLYKHAA
jgi:lipid II:glycine glycyltransferase (peptidoglycan interpeptide bridge formation enzyme)